MSFDVIKLIFVRCNVFVEFVARHSCNKVAIFLFSLGLLFSTFPRISHKTLAWLRVSHQFVLLHVPVTRYSDTAHHVHKIIFISLCISDSVHWFIKHSYIEICMWNRLRMLPSMFVLVNEFQHLDQKNFRDTFHFGICERLCECVSIPLNHFRC